MRVEKIGDAMLYVGDCRDVLQTLPADSVDSIVTDPPYGLKFMGKSWDHGVPGVEFWEHAIRVAKSGAHLLAFGGTRTFHRLACAIEDAGWEIRDCIMWVYASGFPKSHNVALSIDKKLGGSDRGHRIATASRHHPDGTYEPNGEFIPAYEANTTEAEAWEGWGTALKPAWEPIIVARKPLRGTVAENVMKYGTGAINVDGCRIETEDGSPAWSYPNGPGGNVGKEIFSGLKPIKSEYVAPSLGRWPANLIHDGSPEAVAGFPETDASSPVGVAGWQKGGYVGGKYKAIERTGYDYNGGSVARFFYCAKASKEDRDEGLEEFEERNVHNYREDGRVWDITGSHSTHKRNNHPTVKPTDLMRYLVRLVTPPGGTVLDMFVGSGSTPKAAALEGFPSISIDLEDGHIDIACARVAYAQKKAREQPELFEKHETKQEEEPMLFQNEEFN
jgi:DNA modification methylase